MLRIHEIADSASAKKYYTTAEYFLDTPGSWIGKGAEALGLSGRAKQEDFYALCDNINPQTGGPLTVVTRENRRVGWDFNFNATKSIGIVRELTGDKNIEEAHREAVDYAVGEIEKDMATRVRRGGRDEDRATGNLVGMHVVHRTTRPNDDDHLPDMSLHSHVVLFNATHDPVENRFKAAQIGRIKHDAPFYEALYHNRLATNLKSLGYGIRRHDKSFEIAGISEALKAKFSRRKATIEELAAILGIHDAKAKAKLGATTRQGKVNLREEELTDYWKSKLSDAERDGLAQLKGRPSHAASEREATQFAIEHMFERNSVVDERRLYEAAIRQGIGCVSPEKIKAEAIRQGLLTNAGEATTKDVLAEERRIIAFARSGRGTLKPMATNKQLAAAKGFQKLSAEQKKIVMHIGLSTDRVILVEGDAGTGKTDTLQVTIPGIDKPGVLLAPSADASRGVLKSKGFLEADTLARFLNDPEFQEEARGGFIFVDEATLAGFADIDRLIKLAGDLNARVILQGDRKQHGSVARGNLLPVLEEFAGVPVARLKEIWRQTNPEYKEAVALLAKGDMAGGLNELASLGWVKQTDSHEPLVDAYMAARDDKKSVTVVSPTHAEGDDVTAALRARLKDRGLLAGEREFDQLEPVNWTEAERADLNRYDGSEVLRFHRNSGTFKAGERARIADWKEGDYFKSAGDFAVYSPSTIGIAGGDVLRMTAGGKTKDGKHRFDNASVFKVAGFTNRGDIRLANGWTIAKNFAHFTHAYCTTSHASQGKTTDRVLIAMGSKSLRAIDARQFYVSVSRGRESVIIFSDLAFGELREAICRLELRKAASELVRDPKAPPRRFRRTFLQRVRVAYRQLHEKAVHAIRNGAQEKERQGAGYER